MSCNNNNKCVNSLGCSNVCPDFLIKRHNTKPSLELTIKDCNNPVDLTDTIVEVSMWINAKIKTNIIETDTYFALADNIGFDQINEGDIILVDRTRLPEHMLVIGFDENNKYLQVQRGYQGTTASKIKKGTKLRILRFLNAVGSTEMTLTDITQEDGSILTDVLTESKLIYDWSFADTCLPGCYLLEFKLLKTIDAEPLTDTLTLSVPSLSFVSYDPSDIAWNTSSNIEWARRYPDDKEGYIIQIVDTPIENG